MEEQRKEIIDQCKSIITIIRKPTHQSHRNQEVTQKQTNSVTIKEPKEESKHSPDIDQTSKPVDQALESTEQPTITKEKPEMKQCKSVTFLMAMTIPGTGKTSLKNAMSKYLRGY